MAPNKSCELCKCELDEASWISHINGKRHKRNMELNDCRSNTIFIKGYDYRIPPQDIMNFFVNHGEIVNWFYSNGNRTLKIQYQNCEPVRHLTRNNIYFKGRKLNITPASISSNQQVSVNKKAQKLVQETRDADKLHKDIITKLKSSEDFDQQIKILIDFIQDPEDIAIQKFENVKCDLESVLQTYFNCKVHSFGSSVTGLGFRNCDIDIFVELLPIRQKGTHVEAGANAQIAKRILHRSRKFTKIIAIASAKTPIVKCVHKESNISCDVNFKNFFGVYNSQLIKFLISLDSRIKPLVMIIKYWACYNKLAGSGKITNYALVILILFYLQQLEQPILPTIMFLQNFPEVEVLEAGWNCGFFKDTSVLSPVTNTQSVSQLLFGFYDFYFKFEYSLRVISSFAGKCYSRGLFDNANSVPSELHQYKSHLLKSGDVLRTKSPLVLQDPFELGHNLTSNVSLKLLTDFQNCCKHAKDNMESTLNSKPILIHLFNRAPKIKMPKNTCEIVVAVGNHLSYLEHLKISDENSDDQLLKIWFNKVEEYVLNIFTDILFIKTNFINKSRDNKTQRVEGQADVHDRNIYESNTYLCTGQTPVWNKRRKVNKDFLDGSICIQKEKRISEELLTCLVQNSNDNKSIINFNLTIIKFVNPTRILLRLLNNDDSYKTNFLQVSQYCLKKIQTLINQEMIKLKQPLSQNEMSPFEAALIRHVRNTSDDKDEDLTKEDLSEKMHKDLLNILKPATNFGQQIAKLLEFTQESETQLEKKKLEVKQDFEEIFNKHFKCELFFFGSMAAGLGLKTSDIDLFVGLEDNAEITVEESIEKVRDVYSILTTNNSPIFNAVELIICSTPIVRLYHVPTELKCDITFKNRLGVYNSELLKYFISIDERVKPLIMIIKYWAKHHGFGGSKKLTSYALAMMVVFYLQQLQKPILPSVCELQTNIKRIEAGCNAGFNDNKSLLPKIENTQKISELLLGFFEYFTSFDYENKLISPFSGTTHLKESFQSLETLPDVFKNAYDNSNICQKLRGILTVQDPFELHYNITSCASQLIVNMFKDSCNLGISIFKDHSIIDCNLLTQLFEKPASESKMPHTIITIECGDHLQYMMNDGSEKEVPLNIIREQWYDKVHILIKIIFKNILNLELVEEGLDAVADSESSEDDHLNVKEIKKYRYVGNANLMNIDKLLHFSKIKVLNVDKEIVYIENMKKNEEKIENTTERLVDLNLIFKQMINPTEVSLEFNSNVDQNIHYDHILKFSTEYLNLFIDQAIKNIKPPSRRQSKDLQKELNKGETLTRTWTDSKEENTNFAKGLTVPKPVTNKKSKKGFRRDTNNEIGKFLFNNADANAQKKQQLYPNKHGCYMFSNKSFFYKDDIKPPDFVWERGYEKKD